MIGKHKETVKDTGVGKNFLNRTLIAQEIEQELINRVHQIKKLLHIKDTNYQN
jgi:hypothetical protein